MAICFDCPWAGAGYYFRALLTKGNYTVVFTAPGYSTLMLEVQYEEGTTKLLDVVMEVNGIETSLAHTNSNNTPQAAVPESPEETLATDPNLSTNGPFVQDSRDRDTRPPRGPATNAPTVSSACLIPASAWRFVTALSVVATAAVSGQFCY